MTTLPGDDRFRVTDRAGRAVAELRIAPIGLASPEAWISRPAEALIIRGDLVGDGPWSLWLDAGSVDGRVKPAIGGLDLTAAGSVIALRVICDGAMTYVRDRLRLDMATSVVLLVGMAADRIELDDRLCALAVELVRPGRYEELHASAAADRSARRHGR
jgi:hypothetical protein